MDRTTPGEHRARPVDLLGFFLLTFAVTWTAWLGVGLLVRGEGLPSPYASPLATALLFLGIFAPGLSALAVTWSREPPGALQALLERVTTWDVEARWYVFAIGYIVLVKLVAAAGVRWLGGAWPAFGDRPLLLLLAGTVGSTLMGGQLGEELGWRGYALPRMEARWGAGAASLALGVVWAVWHLPLFYMVGADTYGQSFPLYLVQVMGLSVAIAWLHGKTRGSLLLVMLMHASLNNMTGIVPGVGRPPDDPWLPGAPLQGWMTAAVIWVTAIGFLVDMRRGAGTTAGARSALTRARSPS